MPGNAATTQTVPRFLSPEWFTAAASASAPIAEPTLVIQQLVRTGAAGVDVEYAVVVGEGRVTVVAGPVEGADVRVEQDYETAIAIHRGDLAVEDALEAGKVRITGDTARLLTAAGEIAAIGDAPSVLRDAIDDG